MEKRRAIIKINNDIRKNVGQYKIRSIFDLPLAHHTKTHKKCQRNKSITTNKRYLVGVGRGACLATVTTLVRLCGVAVAEEILRGEVFPDLLGVLNAGPDRASHIGEFCQDVGVVSIQK
jgi:hypothetical protein